ncbi:MAG TPA: hypothetical protein VF744_09445 [Beijerinckiaceae bacterium]
MPRRVRILLVLLAMALSGPALAQGSAQGAGQGGALGAVGQRPNASDRSWADEVRSSIGNRGNGQGGDAGQAGKGAPARSDMQTGSTGKGGPGPEKK